MMSRRAAGIGFCSIAAFLYAARYISAAIFGSGVQSWNSDIFSELLRYVGNSLTILSVIALIAGIFYLILAEVRK